MQVDIDEAEAQLSELLDRAAGGEEIVIARAGRPVARLVAYGTKPGKRRPGQWRDRLWMADDFDATPAGIIGGFHGGSRPGP